jgi:tungstate transport system substrate-binding protein
MNHRHLSRKTISAVMSLRDRPWSQLLWIVVVFAALCPAGQVGAAERVVRVAAVITPESSGLLDQLLADFEKKTGCQAIVESQQDVFGLAREGKADLVIAHYGHGGTEDFCTAGLGEFPRPVFSNQSALIGPASDPARVAGARDAVEALRLIAAAKSPFIVNNSASEKYLADVIWHAAGQPDKAGWYQDKGLRNQAETKDAIQAAVREQGYTLWGLVPFLKYVEEHPDCGLKALHTSDPMFQRLMVTVIVRPDKVPGVQVENAKALERYLMATETQAQVRAFRVPGFAGQVWWPAGRNNSGAYLKGQQ